VNLDSLYLVGHISGVKGEARVPVFGRQNVANLMAAACMAIVMKMEPELIWATLAKCRTEWGRGQLVKLETGVSVLFDAYNANPDSMAATLRSLYEMNIEEGGKKIAVLGEMLELGSEAEKLHEELGGLAGQTDFGVIWFIGPSHAAFAKGVKKSGFEKTLIVSDMYEESLAKKVQSVLNPHDVVVMKASRGMKLEKVMLAWNPQFTMY
jgi:UDP-N-acetylmuramoyl-tripeptide--D-alanyl-D-alanine ligase